MSIVPVVDLERARFSAAERAAVARTIDDANRSVGFLSVTGHGVPESVLHDMHQVTAEFFDRPLEEKLTLQATEVGTSRGYMPPKSRALARTRGIQTPADLVEFFSIGQPHVPVGDPYFAPDNAGPNFRPNIWPDEPGHFARVWTSYYREMESLAAELMSLFATALELPADFFAERIDKHISNLFANHYPPLKNRPDPGQLRVGEHTDYGSLTVLYQSNRTAGLEVQVDGHWHAINPEPQTFVINIGDLMARWTNDRWTSTLHRVQTPDPHDYNRRRISLPFFCQPNYDTLIEALPSCVGPDQPPHYEAITSGENMTLKTTQSFAAK